MSKRLAIVGAFALVAVVCVTYQPSFRMGLYLDDYYNIERAGRIEWSNALTQIFDPRAQTLWYRPLQGLQFFIEYQFFGGNANAYHVVNIAYHAINVLLLYAIAWRVSKQWPIGFVAAFFYATFTVYISGVNWVGIVEPLLGVFYLSSFWFWWAYLENGNARDYWLAFAATILALMAKQTALTLPIVFFLADRVLMRKPIALAGLLRRYAWFGAAAVFFLALQYIAPSTNTFTGWFGWKVGTAMASILWEYLILLFLPWGAFPSIDLNPVQVGDTLTYAWAEVALVLLALAAWRERSRLIFFLGVFTLITLLPVLPFPFLEHRYVYLPIVSVAVILGGLFKRAHARLGRRREFAFVASLGLALIALGNGIALNDSMTSAADWARTLRVPFRDIERQNPTFLPDTLLYFVDPITPTEGGLAGMFFLRYGKSVIVRNWTQYAGLREHNAAYVYYFDDTRRPRKIEVEKDAATHSALPLPIDFEASIRLEGYEVPRVTIARGDPIGLILYWRATGKIDRDYTVFAHLVAPDGAIVAQSDSQPRKGRLPTREWAPSQFIADAILIPAGAAVAASGYRIKIGWYDSQTRQRLAVLDARNQRVTDRIEIGSFTIE